MRKIFIILISILLILIAAGFIYYAFNKPKDQSPIIKADFNKLLSKKPYAYELVFFLDDYLEKVDQPTADYLFLKTIYYNNSYYQDKDLPVYQALKSAYGNNLAKEMGNINQANIANDQLSQEVNKYLKSGYIFKFENNELFLELNYAFYINKYGKFINNELRDYYSLKHYDGTRKILVNGELKTSYFNLALRIIYFDEFLTKYPNNKYREAIKSKFKNYLTLYLLGDSKNPVVNQNQIVKPEVIDSYKYFIAREDTNLSSKIIKNHYEALVNNKSRLTEELISSTTNAINKL